MHSDNLLFPHPEMAGPEGLLAIGGDLSVNRLLLAYHFGIFPWYSENQPIMWWSPDPRCVLYPTKLKVSKSMRSVTRKGFFETTLNNDFESVIRHCSDIKRKNQSGTWITQDMIEAYLELHQLGYAHSVEVWDDGQLVGGLYGMSIGKIFFGESMFTLKPNASKFGFVKLVQRLAKEKFLLIDCQQDTPHLRAMGAELIHRKDFMAYIRRNLLLEDGRSIWPELAVSFQDC